MDDELLEILLDDETEETQPITTYKLDLDKKNIQGNITDIESLKQAINKELMTEKYEYSIYSFDYGTELHTLIGMDSYKYVEIEAKRMIKECLSKYSYIDSVTDFNFDFKGDSMTITFTVNSTFGTTTIRNEVA